MKKVWSSRHEELEEEIIRVLRWRNRIRVLDLGCGTGSVSLYVGGKYRPRCHVVGVDFKWERLACARSRKEDLESSLGEGLSCRFVRANIFDFEPGEPFDLIYLEETFHHLEPRKRVFGLLRRLLAPEGKVVISETNGGNSLILTRILLQRGVKSVGLMRDARGTSVQYGKERVLTAGALIRVFERNGFRAESLRHFRLFGTAAASLREDYVGLLERVERCITRFARLSGLLAVHYNVVLVNGRLGHI